MKNKYSYNQIAKLLEKVFKAGYTSEREILSIQLEDLDNIADMTPIDITILIDLKKAIRSRKVIAFLGRNEEKKREDDKNGKQSIKQ